MSAAGFDGRRVLVTGASGGIGGAIARALADAGARVIAHGGSAPPEGLAAEIGGEALAARLDGAAAGADLVRAARAEALVHSAAVQDLVAFGEADWDRFVGPNLAAGEGMLAALAGAGGRAAVLLSSLEATRPHPGHAAYAASKAAVESLTRSAAIELAPMRVNAVAPGLTHRPDLAEDWPEGLARWQAMAPLGRTATAEEVAAAVVFLLSDAASGITGAVLPVDAGMSAATGW